MAIPVLPATAFAAKAAESSPAAGVAQTLIGLGLVVGVIFALAWGVRRFTGLPGMASGTIRLLGGLSVGTRERVVLLQVGTTQLVVGVAPGRVQTLHVLDQPIAAPAASPVTGEGQRFAERLAALMKQGRGS
jgi:flagellar protein FliO/FliZ